MVQAASEDVRIRAVDDRIVRIEPVTAEGSRPRGIWEVEGLALPKALALSRNAVVVAGSLTATEPERAQHALTARSTTDGGILWSHTLPAAPAWWGLATDRSGHVIATLDDGRVRCYAAAKQSSRSAR
jgi:hypothetical protein